MMADNHQKSDRGEKDAFDFAGIEIGVKRRQHCGSQRGKGGVSKQKGENQSGGKRHQRNCRVDYQNETEGGGHAFAAFEFQPDREIVADDGGGASV